MAASSENSHQSTKGLRGGKCLDAPHPHPPECQNLWFHTMTCWHKRAKCLWLLLGRVVCVYVCVFLLPPVNMLSTELNNYSYYLEVIISPPKKLGAGRWRVREIRVFRRMERNQRGCGVSLLLARGGVSAGEGNLSVRLKSPSVDALNWWQWKESSPDTKVHLFSD